MDDKQTKLYESCLEAGYACAQLSFNRVFTSWKVERNLNIPDYPMFDDDSISELINKYESWIGFPTKDDVTENFTDQSGEDLFGDSQADGIVIDETLFPEFNGRNHWAVLDKYFGEESADIVEKAYGEALDVFIKDNFTAQSIPSSQTLVCRSPTFPLDITVSVDAAIIDDVTLESFGDDLKDLLCELLRNYIQPLALDKVCVPLGKIVGDVLGDNLVDAMIEFLDEATKEQLYIERDGYEDEPIPNVWLIDWVREYYEDSSTFCPFAGEGIIQCVREFLENGNWHLDYDEERKPFLWFGPDNSEPLDIWSLPFESDEEYTSWKTIWFRDFWELDWNAILGESGENFRIWMFYEMSMDEPGEHCDRVRDMCPITLSEDDTIESIRIKINNYATSYVENKKE